MNPQLGMEKAYNCSDEEDAQNNKKKKKIEKKEKKKEKKNKKSSPLLTDLIRDGKSLKTRVGRSPSPSPRR